MLKFVWDQKKAASNQKKHGVSFSEASTVFADPLACIFDDESHSTHERREIIIGYSNRQRLVIVCFTERGGAVRIISSRLATKKERNDYEEKKIN